MNDLKPVQEINFDHLQSFLGDDNSVLKEVLSLFRHQTEMWAKLFDPKADDAQWQSVMHSIKGSARAVGASNLAKFCETGESLIGDKADFSQREDILHAIQHKIDRVNIEIGRWEYRQTLASMRS